VELKKKLRDEGDESSDVVPVKHLTTKLLVEFLSTLTLLLASQMAVIPTEGSIDIVRGIESVFACYKVLCRERQKAGR
jgi:hypothetical protein